MLECLILSLMQHLELKVPYLPVEVKKCPGQMVVFSKDFFVQQDLRAE